MGLTSPRRVITCSQRSQVDDSFDNTPHTLAHEDGHTKVIPRGENRRSERGWTKTNRQQSIPKPYVCCHTLDSQADSQNAVTFVGGQMTV